MSQTAAFKQFCKLLNLVSTLKSSEIKAIQRLSTGDFPKTREQDSQIAQQYGVDTDSQKDYTHSECVKRIREVVVKCDLAALARTFVAGLNPDQIRWRAPLQAYAACKNLPLHRADFDKDMYTPPCRVCGVEARQEWKPIDHALMIAECGLSGRSDKESIEPFEAAMCLQWFLISDPPEPDQEDRKRLDQLIGIIVDAPSGTTGNQLTKMIAPAVGGNKYTCSYLVETLGFLGVLVNPRQRGDLQVWTNWRDRAYGTERNQEMLPPACGWRREFGLDEVVLQQLFPEVRIKKTKPSSGRK
ncbi:MAG: hypothetical protein KDA78_04000 [Planctomycetaceae bacterium]|nr:hypothetical protein [Planctomycetaceae bacterium]